jgi:hypothetical protein
MNLKQSTKTGLVWIIAGVMIILASLICINTSIWLPIVFGQYDGTLRNFTVKQIGDFLGKSIPTTATDLDFEGQNINDGLIVLLDLNFDAPNSDAREFANHFCQGVLIENFDPFTDNRLTKFTVNEPVRMWGGECSSRATGGWKISLIPFEATQSHVRLQYLGQCGSHCPDWYHAGHLSPEFTVVLSGNNAGSAVPQNRMWVCVFLIPTAAAHQPNGTMTIPRTTLKMTIDHIALPPFIVSIKGGLEPQYELVHSRVIKTVAAKTYSTNCNYITLANKTHMFTLQIFSPTSLITKYTWQFQDA